MDIISDTELTLTKPLYTGRSNVLAPLKLLNEIAAVIVRTASRRPY
jgi:hypothetical protein